MVQHPVSLLPADALCLAGLTARCKLWAHYVQWQVDLLVGSQLEVVQMQVCRDQEEVLATGEQWKQAMIEKGWR